MIDNVYKFIATIFRDDVFKQATHNQYYCVSCKPYQNKEGKLPNGVRLTLRILKDDFDYGTDKDGNEILNNEGQNFDCTVLSTDVQPNRGDIVALGELDSENTFYINYNLILRYKSCKVLKPAAQQAQTKAGN